MFAVKADATPTVQLNQTRFPHWYDKELVIFVKEKERYGKAYIKVEKSSYHSLIWNSPN